MQTPSEPQQQQQQIRVFIQYKPTRETVLLRFSELPESFNAIRSAAESVFLPKEACKWLVKTKANESYIVTGMPHLHDLIAEGIIPDPTRIHLYMQPRTEKEEQEQPHRHCQHARNVEVYTKKIEIKSCPLHGAAADFEEESIKAEPLVFELGVLRDLCVEKSYIDEAITKTINKSCFCEQLKTQQK